MRKVTNKKIIQTLSFRTMKEKRFKNLIAILAIALTALLFTALFTVGASLVGALEEATMRQVGTSAHGGYKYLTLEEYEKIKAAGGYKDISYDLIAGFAANPELQGMQTEVRYAEDKQAEWMFSYPETGRMPEAENECAASSKVLEALGIPMELGVSVPLSIRTHDQNGQVRYMDCEFTLCGYWQSNEAAHAQELWVSRQWLLENVELMTQNHKQRIIEQQLTDPEGCVQAGIWFDSSYNIEGQMEKLTRRAGFSQEELDISVNWAYAASVVDMTSVLLGMGLLGIIILAGYLIIYNIFYINVSTDIRYYGLLKTIGTTGRQLRKMVRGQALMLSAAGIPLGLFAGVFVGKGLLPFIYTALQTAGVRKVVINPWIFLGAAAFALTVVYLSCIRPCRLATEISPIAAVRYAENSHCARKKKRSARRVTMAGLALANMGRNKRKAAVVLLSLSLSLILLNAAYCLIRGFSFDQYVSGYLVSDMQIEHSSNSNVYADYRDYEGITSEVISYLESLDGVEAVHKVYLKNSSVLMTQKEQEQFAAMWNSDSMDEEKKAVAVYMAQEIMNTQTAGASFMGLSEGMLSLLDVKSGSLDMEKFMQGGYALITASPLGDNWISPGDKIRISDENGDSAYKEELEVMAVVETPSAMGAIGRFLLNMELVVCMQDFQNLFGTQGALQAILDVEEEKEAEISDKIGTYLEANEPELILKTRAILREEFADATNVLAMVGSLLGGVLAFIGVLNLINAMITGILARKQEFAMMQAVGMTGKQLRGMLAMEGIWYGIWTLGIAATMGNLISYGLLYLISQNMNYFVWRFYPEPFLVYIPVILFLSAVLPVICYYTLCRKSIIERIRIAEV